MTTPDIVTQGQDPLHFLREKAAHYTRIKIVQDETELAIACEEEAARYTKAADEIERLRALVETYRNNVVNPDVGTLHRVNEAEIATINHKDKPNV